MDKNTTGDGHEETHEQSALEEATLPLVGRIVERLLASEEVDLNAVRAENHLTDGVQLELAIHAARERVRKEHGIDFAPVAGKGGVVHRADPARIAKRSIRGRRAGLKKLERAADRMSLAAMKSSGSEQGRLEQSAGSQKTQLAAARLRGGRLRELLKKN